MLKLIFKENRVCGCVIRQHLKERNSLGDMVINGT
jgi:hypothetical protein